MTKRIDKVTAQLTDLGIDALLITDEINTSYLSGFSGDSSYLLVTSKGTTILSDRRYETQIASECPDLDAAIRPPTQTMLELVNEVVSGTQIANLGIESDHVNVSLLRGLETELPHLKLHETSGITEALRMIKDECEIEIIRKSIDIAQRSLQSVLPRLTPDWTERQVAFELEAIMRSLGAEGVSFTPIVGAEPSGALPHYCPADTKIADAATLLIDWGAKYRGYASDLTRTFHRDHASAEFKSAYQAVLDSQLASIEAIRPGARTADVDQAARGVLSAAGLGEAFKHGLGHGIGLQIHEGPRISSISPDVLETGMVITVEPGVYFESNFGIRIEDDVLVTESGYEVLSTLPKGLDDCRLML